MKKIACITTLLLIGILDHSSATQRNQETAWTSDFNLNKEDLTSTGRNPYFILEPGYRLTFTDGNDRLVITVLDKTRTVDGVETRVVEERETNRGRLKEVSRNYFAIDKRSLDVYYFGEEVDMYRSGKIAGHEGAWIAGENGAKFGLMMPGAPKLRSRHYQEIAPKVAMDRAEIVSLTETVKTPAGTFKLCLKAAESTPLEPGVTEYKYYARGVGLIQDGPLKLVNRGK